MLKRYLFATLTMAALVALAVPAFAAKYDTPTVTINSIGHTKISMTVTAGPSGAPDGFGVYWMTYADYADYGEVWPSVLTYPGLGWSFFTGTPTLNDFADGADYKLAPFESMTIEIGDLEDEDAAGYNSNNPGEMTDDVDYVLCTFAKGGSGFSQSDFSQNVAGKPTLQGTNCTFTQGYWKNHPNAWPVSSLTLGSVVYTKPQLLSILGQSVGGNGLISLCHQLIATKLNIAQGAIATPLVTSTIAAANAQIGALVCPPVGAGSLTTTSTSAKTQILDNFNQGITGPGHCGNTPTHNTTWGRIKSLYR